MSLDIICRPWVPENAISEIQKPPSWLVTTENTAFGARPDRNYGRKNADTLVGVPGLSNRDYSASKETKVTPVAYRPDRPTTGWCFGTGAKAHSTYVEGFVIDLVSTKKPYAADGIIVNEWLAAGECYVHGLMDGEASAMKQHEKNNKSALTVDPVSVDMRGIIPDLQRPLASFTRRNIRTTFHSSRKNRLFSSLQCGPQSNPFPGRHSAYISSKHVDS